MVNSNSFKHFAEYATKEYCVKNGIQFYGFPGGIEKVCQGGADMLMEGLLPHIATGFLSPSRICDEYLGVCSKPGIVELNEEDFVKRVVGSKPESTKNNDFVNNIYKTIAADPNPRKMIRSIQLTDIHIDFKY